MTSTMARDALTATEKAALEKFVQSLTKTESQFCCGGTIQVPSDQKFNLLYKLGTSKHAQSMDLSTLELEAADIEKLLEACAPAPHGRGTETVYDDSYRLARELHQGDFALTKDIAYSSGILNSIAALTSPRDHSGQLVADLYKLNAYSTGGFFKSHRDTPKSDRHIGTLVVALPIPFEGGALRVSHEGTDVHFNWGGVMPTASDPDQVNLPWAFLFSDVEHEVLPVTSGTRVTLAYDIFVSSTETSSAPEPAIDGATLPLHSDLHTLLNNPEFLPKGGKVGLALSHAYPINTTRDSNFFASHLKGRDAALHRALLALRIPMELRAVYAPYNAYVRDRVVTFPRDGYEPVFFDKYGDTLLYTSKRFHVIEVDDQWEKGEEALVKTEGAASLEPDIIWVCKPGTETFTKSGTYMAYGNEASIEEVYAAAALVLDIPPAGEAARAIL